jgi:hypothetical protein
VVPLGSLGNNPEIRSCKNIFTGNLILNSYSLGTDFIAPISTGAFFPTTISQKYGPARFPWK